MRGRGLGLVAKESYPVKPSAANVSDEQIWNLFPSATQIGCPGCVTKGRKEMLGTSAAMYIKTLQQGPPGRLCNIHLTFHASPKAAKRAWKAIDKTLHTSPTVIEGVGDEAMVVHLGGDGAGDYALARFRNARVMMTDQAIAVSPPSVKRLAVNWSFVKHIFREMESLPQCPIPPGVKV